MTKRQPTNTYWGQRRDRMIKSDQRCKSSGSGSESVVQRAQQIMPVPWEGVERCNSSLLVCEWASVCVSQNKSSSSSTSLTVGGCLDSKNVNASKLRANTKRHETGWVWGKRGEERWNNHFQSAINTPVKYCTISGKGKSVLDWFFVISLSSILVRVQSAFVLQSAVDQLFPLSLSLSLSPFIHLNEKTSHATPFSLESQRNSVHECVSFFGAFFRPRLILFLVKVTRLKSFSTYAYIYTLICDLFAKYTAERGEEKHHLSSLSLREREYFVFTSHLHTLF